MPEPSHSDADIDAALAAIADPARLQQAQDIVVRAAPSLQRVLAMALQEGGWFDSAHHQAVREAAGTDDAHDRLRAAPSLQRVLGTALDEGGWFGAAHDQAVREAAGGGDRAAAGGAARHRRPERAGRL